MLPQANSSNPLPRHELTGTGRGPVRWHIVKAASQPQRLAPVQSAKPNPVKGFLSSVRLSQIACWQLALTLFGVTATRPWPVAMPGATCTAILLALTTVRLRGRWLHEWVGHYARYRARARNRYLPRQDGPRAVLHLLAPDASLTSIDADTAALSRRQGSTAVLRLDDVDPLGSLPRPGALLPGADVGVRIVFHGVAGDRRVPLAWIAVQAMRTSGVSEEDDLAIELRTALRRVRDRLAEQPVTALDHDGLLRTIASLAHVGDDRGDVRERWRTWRCGPIAQAGFRLTGWSTSDNQAALLHRVLTARAGAVVTVSLTATGPPTEETAIMRIAAPNPTQLERSVATLRTLAAPHIRLDRMNGEHRTAIATCLPLGTG
jgi:ESX secretion system protein EccE